MVECDFLHGIITNMILHISKHLFLFWFFYYYQERDKQDINNQGHTALHIRTISISYYKLEQSREVLCTYHNTESFCLSLLVLRSVSLCSRVYSCLRKEKTQHFTYFTGISSDYPSYESLMSSIKCHTSISTVTLQLIPTKLLYWTTHTTWVV